MTVADEISREVRQLHQDAQARREAAAAHGDQRAVDFLAGQLQAFTFTLGVLPSGRP